MTPSLIPFAPPPITQGNIEDCGMCGSYNALVTIAALTRTTPPSFADMSAQYMAQWGSVIGASPIFAGITLGFETIPLQTFNTPPLVLAQEIQDQIDQGHPCSIEWVLRAGVADEGGPLALQSGQNSGVPLGEHDAIALAVSGTEVTIEMWGTGFGNGRGLYKLDLASIAPLDLHAVDGIATPAEDAVAAQVQAEIVGQSLTLVQHFGHIILHP